MQILNSQIIVCPGSQGPTKVKAIESFSSFLFNTKVFLHSEDYGDKDDVESKVLDLSFFLFFSHISLPDLVPLPMFC